MFDEEGWVLPGKGDIYTEEEMRSHVEWTDDVKAAFKRGGGSSSNDWRYYSKLENKLIDNVVTS